MHWNEYFKSLKAGNIDCVYLFSGPEERLKTDALAAMRAALLPPGLEQLNDTTLEGINAQQIIDAAETMPMMCDRRMLVVRDWAPLLPGKSKNEDSEVEQMQKWLEAPPESCVLIFYMRTDLDSRKRMATLLKKKASIVSFEYLNDAELSRWTEKYLKSCGKQMERKALDTLTFMAGRDLTRLSGELDKLSAYVEDRAEITEHDVREIVSASLEYNVFELLNRLLEGNLREAQRMANNLLKGGQNAIGILAMLSRQLRQMTHMRYALDAGEVVQSIQETLKMHPYAAKQTARQCKMLNADIWKMLYTLCIDTEYDIKRGKLREQTALDVILLKISNVCLAK